MRLVLQIPPHLLAGVQRSCQVFCARLTPPLSSNEICLTMTFVGSIKAILCSMPRETNFSCHLLCPSVLCRKTRETKSQTTAHDGEAVLLLASITCWKNHGEPESPGAALQHP